MSRGVTGVLRSGQCLVMFLPMLHGYGLILSAVAHCIGCKIVFMSKFEIDEYLGLIQTYRPENLQVVPPIMVLLAKYPRVSEYDLSSVNRIMCAAAPVSAEIENAIAKRLNIEDNQQGYGMTEAGLHIYILQKKAGDTLLANSWN